MALAPKVRTGPLICGFCSTGNHEHCPRAIRNGDGTILPCNCQQSYCGGQVVRCLVCKNEEEGTVSPDSWRCLDRDACEQEVRARQARNPTLQMIRELEKRVNETTAEKPAKKAAAPKEGKCLHCGEKTQGGKFLPGHDASWVKDLVADTLEGKRTEESVLQEMVGSDASDALQAKYRKSVKLTREAADKKKAAAAEKAAQLAAAAVEKEAKAKAKAAAAAAEKESQNGEAPAQAKPGKKLASSKA